MQVSNVIFKTIKTKIFDLVVPARLSRFSIDSWANKLRDVGNRKNYKRGYPEKLTEANP